MAGPVKRIPVTNKNEQEFLASVFVLYVKIFKSVRFWLKTFKFYVNIVFYTIYQKRQILVQRWLLPSPFIYNQNNKVIAEQEITILVRIRITNNPSKVISHTIEGRVSNPNRFAINRFWPTIGYFDSFAIINFKSAVIFIAVSI